MVTSQKKKLDVLLSGISNEFVIEAINQGSQGLNTAMVVVEGDQSVSFQTNLLEKETAKVTILKQH
jgi:hypothetical protein